MIVTLDKLLELNENIWKYRIRGSYGWNRGDRLDDLFHSAKKRYEAETINENDMIEGERLSSIIDKVIFRKLLTPSNKLP